MLATLGELEPHAWPAPDGELTTHTWSKNIVTGGKLVINGNSNPNPLAAKRGPKPPPSVFVGKHQGKNRRGGIAGTDVQFQVMEPFTDADLKVNHVLASAPVRLGFRADSDVVHDARKIRSARLDSGLNDAVNRIGAGEREFPVCLDRFDLGKVHQDTVGDGVGSGVAEDTFSEGIVGLAHGFVPLGTCERGTVLAPYRLLPIGDFRPIPVSQSPRGSAEAVSGTDQRGGSGSGALGVVEPVGTTLIGYIIRKSAAGS